MATKNEYAPVLVTWERFAEMTSLPIGVVIGFMNRKFLPSVKIGKYNLVNLELLRKRCLEGELE